MKRILFAVLVLCLLFPFAVSAQTTISNPNPPTVEPTLETATLEPAGVTIINNPAPSPAVEPTDVPYLGLGFLVLATVAVGGVGIYVVQHPTAAGLATALADVQKNRALLDVLEMKYQTIPKDAQEALNVTVTLLRVISGVIPSIAITATIAFLEDIRQPGIPVDLQTQMSDHDARLARIEAQMTDDGK